MSRCNLWPLVTTNRESQISLWKLSSTGRILCAGVPSWLPGSIRGSQIWWHKGPQLLRPTLVFRKINHAYEIIVSQNINFLNIFKFSHLKKKLIEKTLQFYWQEYQIHGLNPNYCFAEDVHFYFVKQYFLQWGLAKSQCP